MNKVLGILLFCSLSMGYSAYAVAEQSAQKFPEGVELLRQGVIHDYTSGWQSASSESARFEVDFPLPFNEWKAYTDEHKDPIYSLGVISKEGVSFMVSEFPRAIFQQTEDLDRFIKNSFAKQEIMSKGFFQYQGREAAEVKIKDTSKNIYAFYRYVLSETYIYQLSIEYPGKHARLARKLRKDFMDSLVVVGE